MSKDSQPEFYGDLNCTLSLNGAPPIDVTGMRGSERLSTPYSLTVQLIKDERSMMPASVLGATAMLYVWTTDNRMERAFHGVVHRFTRVNEDDSEGARYELEIVPRLRLLAYASHQRVFIEKTALEIVQEVLRDGNVTVEVSCSGPFRLRKHCVQVGESDFDFVSRLLEEEGVYYFFKHTKHDHSMVLAAPPAVPASAWGVDSLQDSDGSECWGVREEAGMHTGAVTVYGAEYDANFQPAVGHSSTRASAPATGSLESWMRPTVTSDDVDASAKRLMEMHEATQVVLSGSSSVVGMQSGAKVTFGAWTNSLIKGEFMLVSVTHRLGSQNTRSTSLYENDFTAIPSETPFRPPLVTPRPRVIGAHGAIVTKAGSEVDAFGGVFVRFFWGSEGTHPILARLASVWAGNGFGFVQLPRVGDEVLVEFIDGHPDYPIVVGRLYNASNKPPFALPDNHTQTGFQTERTNVLLFEDKPDAELVRLEARKDYTTLVHNDEKHDVEHDRTTTIKNDDTRTVTDGNDELTVETGDQTITLKGKRTLTVTGDSATTIEKGKHAVTVKTGDHTLEVSTGNAETKVSTGNHTTTVSLGNLVQKAGVGKVTIEATSGIELKCGANSIVIDQSGVTIKGLNVSVEGQIQTEVKGLMVTLEGSAMATVKGGVTMIN